jgi:hypothetical protein
MLSVLEKPANQLPFKDIFAYNHSAGTTADCWDILVVLALTQPAVNVKNLSRINVAEIAFLKGFQPLSAA